MGAIISTTKENAYSKMEKSDVQVGEDLHMKIDLFHGGGQSSTNKVKSGHTGAYSTYTPSTSSNNIPKREVTDGFADEVMYSLFAKQSEDLNLLHEDLEQIDDMDIEEMDINWQIAMIAIRMKKFYKKTGRLVRIDGNKPVGFDKKKLECFKCHNTGHFARECTSNGTNDGKKRDSFYQDQGAGKKEQNQNCLLTMDDGVVNWGEHTVEEVETNHALMAISSNNEVSLCSKTCIDSYNKLKTLCDEQTNQLGEQEAKILAYNQAVKKLEAQVVTFQKQQLSLNEQLTFQANELYEKDEKLKKYRRIGMKAVKEKEQLQKTVDSWKDSSKNLWKLVNSGMTGSFGNPSEHSIEFESEIISVPKEVSESKSVTTNEKVVSEPKPKEVEPSCTQYNQCVRGAIRDHPLKNMEINVYLLVDAQGTCTRVNLSGYMDDFEMQSGDLLPLEHKFIFTETECLVVSPDFKMPDENQILLKVPRQHNMYSFDMKTPAPTKDYACLIAKPTSDESKLWHRSENQTNPHAGTSEVTNSACTLQTPNANASEEEDEAEELIVVPTVAKHTVGNTKSVGYFQSCNSLSS
ncbi:ribonuclease H-like domain-containing protein [Tanacetum coccineum]